MENLNKENFWNELQEKYPDGMKVFCDWIDKYKKENNWNILFNNGKQKNYGTNFNRPTDKNGNWTHDIKFHDIPLAMQIGIWIEFVSEVLAGVHEWEIEDLANHDWKKDITEHIKMIHSDKLLHKNN